MTNEDMPGGMAGGQEHVSRKVSSMSSFHRGQQIPGHCQRVSRSRLQESLTCLCGALPVAVSPGTQGSEDQLGGTRLRQGRPVSDKEACVPSTAGSPGGSQSRLAHDLAAQRGFPSTSWEAMSFLVGAGSGKEDSVRGAVLCLETTRPSQEGCCPEKHRVGKQQKGGEMIRG